jgi:hypothetical protein
MKPSSSDAGRHLFGPSPVLAIGTADALRDAWMMACSED